MKLAFLLLLSHLHAVLDQRHPDDPDFEPTEAEVDEALELANPKGPGKPVKMSAEEGIASMHRRIAQLEEEIQRATGGGVNYTSPQLDRLIADNQRQIADLRKRLIEYELQHQSKN